VNDKPSKTMLVALALILGSCSAPPGKTTDEGWTSHGRGTWTKPVDIDGVRCILVEGDYSGGIACNWAQR
jgi:hypothetical protein